MSKTKLRQARFSVNQLVKQTVNLSYASQADMRILLFRCIKDLHQLGFKLSHIKGLQTKHIAALIKNWQQTQKKPGTIKNYLAKLRRAAHLIGKPHLLKPTNTDYGIPCRSYYPMHNKAIQNLNLNQCTDPLIRLALEGQAVFGLRREEALKFIWSIANLGHGIKLQRSWTKCGIGRTIPITNQAQRDWLAKLAATVQPGHSLIPPDKTYKQQLSQYQVQAKLMGMRHLHGLRHAYAQRRYQELTKHLSNDFQGLRCPLAGGKSKKSLTEDEKQLDTMARLIISRELGHKRLSITTIYCG